MVDAALVEAAAAAATVVLCRREARIVCVRVKVTHEAAAVAAAAVAAAAVAAAEVELCTKCEPHERVSQSVMQHVRSSGRRSAGRVGAAHALSYALHVCK